MMKRSQAMITAAALAVFAWGVCACSTAKAAHTDSPEDEAYQTGRDTLHSVVVRPEDTYFPPIRPTNDFWTRVWTDKSRFDIGERVRILFQVSDDAYVYIFNTDAAGVTRQLFPNYYDRDNFISHGRRHSIPRGGYSLVATGPAGRESLRITAYRRRYHALDTWHKFERRDPFPVPQVSPDSMRSRAQKEFESSRRGDAADPKSLRIMPVPFPEVYAEHTIFIHTGRGGDPPLYPRPGPGVPSSALRLETTPSGADVYIDGQHRGKTPGLFSVTPGNHKISLIKNRYAVVFRDITIRENHTQKMKITLKRGR